MDAKLNELLKWSIENSSPEELHRQALRAGTHVTTSDTTITTGNTTTTATTPAATTTSAALGNTSSTAPLMLEHSVPSSAPVPEPTSVQQMDPKWMDIVLGQSDVVRMKEARDVLLNPSATKEELEEALDNLLFLIESIDNANDLHTIGGLKPVISCLKSPHSSVRMGAAWVLATAAQNNAKVQGQITEQDGLALLLEVLNNDKSSEVRSKALSALSAILGHNPDAVHKFDALKGFQSLLNCVTDANAGDLVFHKKVAFITRQLMVYENMEFLSPRLLELGFVKSFGEVLTSTDDIGFREKILDFLLTSLQQPSIRARAADELNQIKLKATLESIASEAEETPEKKEDYRDVLELVESILKLL